MRILDNFFYEGPVFIYKIILAIFSSKKFKILEYKNSHEALKFLKDLSFLEEIDHDLLFGATKYVKITRVS